MTDNKICIAIEHRIKRAKEKINTCIDFVVYWLFSSSDRLMIAKLIGNEYTGIYAIGAKLGSASQLIYIAFAGGWQYFAFSVMKEKNQVKTNSLIYEYLGVLSYVATLFVCALSYSIYRLCFEGEYILGYIVAPYLFLAPLLQMLFQVAANQFIVVKKTWPNIFILGIGAVVNIILNFVLIPKFGIEGAALATLAGYVISDVICTIILIKMRLMEVSKRFVFSTVLLFIAVSVWRMFYKTHVFMGLELAIGISLVYIYLYRRELIWILDKIRKR